jgi:hypothetical protein
LCRLKAHGRLHGSATVHSALLLGDHTIGTVALIGGYSQLSVCCIQTAGLCRYDKVALVGGYSQLSVCCIQTAGLCRYDKVTSVSLSDRDTQCHYLS